MTCSRGSNKAGTAVSSCKLELNHNHRPRCCVGRNHRNHPSAYCSALSLTSADSTAKRARLPLSLSHAPRPNDPSRKRGRKTVSQLWHTQNAVPKRIVQRKKPTTRTAQQGSVHVWTASPHTAVDAAAGQNSSSWRKNTIIVTLATTLYPDAQPYATP